MVAELDFWHIMKNGVTMKEKVIAKESMVGSIRSDTDVAGANGGFSRLICQMGQLQDDRRWTESGIIQKNGMQHVLGIGGISNGCTVEGRIQVQQRRLLRIGWILHARQPIV
eukprot:12494343-Ditylum_brightwellii.AAC.1